MATWVQSSTPLLIWLSSSSTNNTDCQNVWLFFWLLPLPQCRCHKVLNNKPIAFHSLIDIDHSSSGFIVYIKFFCFVLFICAETFLIETCRSLTASKMLLMFANAVGSVSQSVRQFVRQSASVHWNFNLFLLNCE